MLKSKKSLLVYLTSCLIVTSCVFSEKEEEKEDRFLFQDANVTSIGFSIDGEEDYEILKDSLLLKEVNEALSGINSKKLIIGKRQHGAKNLYSLKLAKEEDDLLLFVNRTKGNEVTIDFFEENKTDNFNYFLGCLYEAEYLYEVLDKRLSELNKL